MGQFRRLGCSLDYSRERFTMDDDYVRAVMTFFVRLWERGWIYRGEPHRQLVPVPPDGDLRPRGRARGDGRHALHDPLPVRRRRRSRRGLDRDRASGDDPRGRRGRRASRTTRAIATAIGREVIVPYIEQRVPVIADERIDREFGTGALKVTPGHDPLDFDIGRDHGLPEPMAVGWDGRMSEAAGDLAGLTQEEAGARVRRVGARSAVSSRSREPYRHSVGTCERCHSRIEPLISLQWWCAMQEPAAPAIAALEERRVRYHPESQHRFAIASLEETPDWCISRQLWWGHQLPIWYCPDGHTTVEVDEPSACAECGSIGARARVGRPRHVVLVGALAVSRRSAGRTRRRSSRATTPATSTRRRARSSASG